MYSQYVLPLFVMQCQRAIKIHHQKEVEIPLSVPESVTLDERSQDPPTLTFANDTTLGGKMQDPPTFSSADDIVSFSGLEDITVPMSGPSELIGACSSSF